MSEGKLLRVGIIGTIVTALCCFTPILVLLFSAIGLAAVVPALDYVLFPLLAIFIVITGYALWMRKNRKSR